MNASYRVAPFVAPLPPVSGEPHQALAPPFCRAVRPFVAGDAVFAIRADAGLRIALPVLIDPDKLRS